MKQWEKILIDMIGRVDAGRINDRSWIQHGPLKAYIRVTKRLMDGEQRKTIDIASVDVLPSERRKGAFSSWLKEVERIAEIFKRTIYVENVYNKHLEEYLIRIGYSPCNEKSYFKFLV